MAMNNTAFILLGISIIFICTTLGASFVFFLRKKEVSVTLNQIFTGFAAGVMLSAAFFGLINPVLEEEISYMPNYLVAAIGVILGALFLWGIDKLLPHFHSQSNEDEGLPSRISKTNKMFLAVTIHNVPEGLSVGVAFAVALAATGEAQHALMISALSLAIGIGIQNIPEGMLVALPFKAETGSNRKAFVYGFLSGIVEPIAAGLGLLLAFAISSVMPWALAFAGGCMIYVIAEEMIPEFSNDSTHHFGVWSFILGFAAMMCLDVALG